MTDSIPYNGVPVGDVPSELLVLPPVFLKVGPNRTMLQVSEEELRIRSLPEYYRIDAGLDEDGNTVWLEKTPEEKAVVDAAAQSAIEAQQAINAQNEANAAAAAHLAQDKHDAMIEAQAGIVAIVEQLGLSVAPVHFITEVMPTISAMKETDPENAIGLSVELQSLVLQYTENGGDIWRVGLMH